MKKLLLTLVLIGFFCVQCSSTDPIQEQTINHSTLNAETKEQIRISTERMMIAWRRYYRDVAARETKVFTLDGLYENYRSQINDAKQQTIFDEFGRLPEILAFRDQSQQIITRLCHETSSAGRAKTTFWDESQVLSEPLKMWMAPMKIDFQYSIITMESANNYELSNALIDVAWNYEAWVDEDPNLTQDEKTQFAAMIQTITTAIPSIVDEMRSVLEPEGRIMINWDRFARKLGNILIHMVIGAIVVGLIGVAIVASGGSAALLEPILVTIGGYTFEAVASSMIYGGAAGLLVGTVASLANSCLVIPTDPLTGTVQLGSTHYEPCY